MRNASRLLARYDAFLNSIKGYNSDMFGLVFCLVCLKEQAKLIPVSDLEIMSSAEEFL